MLTPFKFKFKFFLVSTSSHSLPHPLWLFLVLFPETAPQVSRSAMRPSSRSSRPSSCWIRPRWRPSVRVFSRRLETHYRYKDRVIHVTTVGHLCMDTETQKRENEKWYQDFLLLFDEDGQKSRNFMCNGVFGLGHFCSDPSFSCITLLVVNYGISNTIVLEIP